MSDVQNDAEGKGTPRDRSPSYPSIGLEKAVERTRQLFTKAKRHEVRLADAAADWNLGAKSSSTLQLVSSLLAFGLIESSAGSDGRKIKVSESGRRILEDERLGVRETLLAEAAMKPKLIADYAERWKDGRPDESHSISQLKFDSGFTDDAAHKFLRVFDETIRFTKGSNSDNKVDKSTDAEAAIEVKVGDTIQWTNGGADQFNPPATVMGVSDDRQWLWVAESKTGIPMNELQVVNSPHAGQGGASVKVPPPPPAHVLAALAKTDVSLAVQREEKFALTEGDVIISFPEGLSADSVEDLEAYLKVFLKKAQREAGVKKKDEAAN